QHLERIALAVSAARQPFRHPEQARNRTSRSGVLACKPELQPYQRFVTSIRSATLALADKLNEEDRFRECIADRRFGLIRNVGQPAVGGQNAVARTLEVVGNAAPGVAQLVSRRSQINHLAGRGLCSVCRQASFYQTLSNPLGNAFEYVKIRGFILEATPIKLADDP